MPPPALSPRRRLGLALLLSALAHAALVSLLTRPDGGGARAPAPLTARLANPPRAASQPTAPPRATPAAPTPAPALPSPAPAEPATPPSPDASPAPSPADAPPEIPADYLPLAGLAREPELVTEVPPDVWPPLPGAPDGVFRLELAIGADGVVDLVVPRCEPALCPAANAYAEIVRQWRFQPAELLGRPVRSKLKLEFELGDPARADAQAPRQ